MTKCKNCGKEFTMLTTVQLFCVDKCRNQYHQKKVKKQDKTSNMQASVDELSLMSARIFRSGV